MPAARIELPRIARAEVTAEVRRTEGREQRIQARQVRRHGTAQLGRQRMEATEAEMTGSNKS